MRIGVHLPQFGRLAGPDAIRRAALRAEGAGFADIWVSDHVVLPAEFDYPVESSPLYDPLLALTWAAAATRTIGIGISAVVLPLHDPLWLAKALATLDVLSGGRLTIVAAVGWLEEEFEALGVPFRERGRRADEILEILQTCWQQDPATFSGRSYAFPPVRTLPQPAHRIPVWVGGGSEAAYRRAVRAGAGFQFAFASPEDAGRVVERLRRDRSEREFTISVRVRWDLRESTAEEVVRHREDYAAAGVEHMVVELVADDLDGLFAQMDDLAARLPRDAT